MESMNRRISKNLLYNYILQVITILLPLALTPYLTRVIGATGIGEYAYTYSIAQYFVLAATLGTGIYGTRQIAYVRNNEKELKSTFWSIFILRFMISAITIVVYVIFFSLFSNERRIYFLLQVVLLIANQVDISWLFAGLEEFKKNVLRSLLVKVIGFVLVFIMVRSEHDTWKYIMIQGGSLLIGNLSLWLGVPTSIRRLEWDKCRVISHFFPAVKIFIPQIAIDIYVLFDKTMLGILTNVDQVGYYDKAEQFAKLPISIIAVISTVMLPVMSSLFTGSDDTKIKSYLSNSIGIAVLIGSFSSFMIAGIADNFVPWMLGEGFLDSIVIMKLLAPLSLIISLSNIIGRQYLIPAKKEIALSISVMTGAIINFILNALFIPRTGVIGASIATLVAESAVTGIQLAWVLKMLDGNEIVKSLVKKVIAGIIMYMVVIHIGYNMEANILSTLIQGISGCVVYTMVLFMEKDKNILICLNYMKGRS